MLGWPTILVVAVATGSETVPLALEGLQAVTLVVAVFGLAELLDHLAPATARLALLAGFAGYAGTLLAIALIPVVRPDGASFRGAVLIAAVATVARILSGVWLAATGLAIARGNGRRTGLLGEIVGVTAIVQVVALWTGLFPSGSVIAGLGLLVGIGEVLFLIVAWRFVHGALGDSPMLS